MNGYKIMSDGYKAFLQAHPEEPEEAKAGIQRKIKALDFLADCSKEEKLELFNSGAFNDVIKGYFKMSIDNSDLKDESKKELQTELLHLLDTVTAGQAEEYYNRLLQPYF